MANRALVRQVSASFERALRREARGALPDPGLASAQHANYVQALHRVGLEVHVLPALDTQPDACFVEDRLIVAGGRGLLTRSKVPERAGESESLAAAVRALMPLTEVRSGSIDGGDVIRLGQTVLVGLSERTDMEGARALERWGAATGARVVPVSMQGGLHLKCEASRLAPDALLCVEGWPYRDLVPAGVRVVTVPRDEAYAANVVATPHGVVMAAGYPHAVEAVRALGREVITVDVSAFRVADGALTCLSVLLDAD